MPISEQNYVEEAEKVISKLAGGQGKNGRMLLTISKLRNLLSMTADIYNEVLSGQNDELSDEVRSRIEYLRVRFLYEAGRDEAVRKLVEEANILDMLKGIQGNRKQFILFNRYMEALVAFHRYYGGED